jgi:RNA polymerase sigma-70 factor (ECF subfamily)
LLLRAIRAGDSTAARPLYGELRPSIERGLRRVLKKKPDDFEDLVQVTFERVVGSVVNDRFRGDSQLSTWAYAIAIHVATDFMRKSFQERGLLEPVDVHVLDQRPHHQHTERQLEARSEMRRVQAVLQRMNRLNASMLVLHDVCRHTVPEVARMLNLSESAAASRLRRARVEFARRSNKNIQPGSSPNV